LVGYLGTLVGLSAGFGCSRFCARYGELDALLCNGQLLLLQAFPEGALLGLQVEFA
jgi:hypothetical protein